jgi:PilZ domain
MNSRERRLDTRVNVNLPLRFRVLNIPNSEEQTAQSINISQRGILFATAVPLVVGTPLEVSLKMPRELQTFAANDVKCVARVVHVQPNAFLGGKTGIGLHIERYEAGAAIGGEENMAVGAGAGSEKVRWAS